MAECMETGGSELAADHIAERAVERREHRGIVAEGERQQRQRARRRDAAERGTGEIEIERALLHIGEHLRVGAEATFREDIEAERAVGLAMDCLGHLGEALGGRARGGLVDAETVLKAGIEHRTMIVAGAGWAMPLAPQRTSPEMSFRDRRRRGPESMDTGLWKMDSELAATPRAGMTSWLLSARITR